MPESAAAPALSEQLAELCFRSHVPEDVRERGRSIVLAAIWHLHRRAALNGLRSDRAFKWGTVGKRVGLPRGTLRAAVAELVTEGLVDQDPGYHLALTPAGYAACRELLDVDAILAADRRRLAGRPEAA